LEVVNTSNVVGVATEVAVGATYSSHVTYIIVCNVTILNEKDRQNKTE